MLIYHKSSIQLFTFGQNRIMVIDILIMTYVVLMVLLIYQAEKLPEHSLKIILVGLVLTPVIGAFAHTFYHRQVKLSVKKV